MPDDNCANQGDYPRPIETLILYLTCPGRYNEIVQNNDAGNRTEKYADQLYPRFNKFQYVTVKHHEGDDIGEDDEGKSARSPLEYSVEQIGQAKTGTVAIKHLCLGLRQEHQHEPDPPRKYDKRSSYAVGISQYVFLCLCPGPCSLSGFAVDAPWGRKIDSRQAG